MSILQEYEEIKRNMGEDKYNAIERYLDLHYDVSLSDIYYTEDGWNEFENWYKRIK